MTDIELANLIFPNVTQTVEDLEKRYPPRNLPEGAEVTRFAPSPTGFLHTGSLFTSMICHKVAKQSKGVFYVRLEDTDTKREIQGSGKQLIEQLKIFNVVPDEGYFGDHQKGADRRRPLFDLSLRSDCDGPGNGGQRGAVRGRECMAERQTDRLLVWAAVQGFFLLLQAH